jgi:hypothetical protein
MRRIFPPLVLVFTAFFVAELLPGSAPITQPGLWPFLLLIYGPGALLVRETVRRTNRGWVSVLLLGAAYGLVEEGLALQSLFNPTLYNAGDWGARFCGINGVYALAAITIHAVWSVAVPILLVDLMFPDRRDRPYLGRLGLIATGFWYILGAALLALLARFSIAPEYRAEPAVLGATALLTLVLAVVALVVPRASEPPPRPGVSPPTPLVVLLAIGVASLFWHALLAILWRIDPAFARWPLVLAPMLCAIGVILVIAWLLRRWTATEGWNHRHRLAVAGALVVSHSVVGGAILADTVADRLGAFLLLLATIIVLSLLGRRLRARVPGRDCDAAGALAGPR